MSPVADTVPIIPTAIKPSPQMHVRPANPSDIPSLLSVSLSSQHWLIEQGLALPAEQPPITPDRMSWFTKLSGEEGWGTRGGRIFVAVVGEEVKGKAGMIIGWCMATMAYPPHLPDTLLSQLYLSAIYVHASYVTQGVGRQLVQYLATEAGKGHAELIRAECKRLPKLVQMHESWGFTPVRYTGWAEDYEDKMQLFHMDLRTDEEREQDEYVEDEDEEDE